MSIQDIGADLEAIADDLRQWSADDEGALGQIIERIRVQAFKCRNPRGDYIDYEHDEGSDKITLCGIPVRGVLKVTWSKSVRERPVVLIEASARTKINDVRRLSNNLAR